MKKYYNAWRAFLTEAPRDAKVLRNINIDFLKKEVEKGPEEEIRDYFSRLQQLERENPPIFPTELVNWIEGLPDDHFPRDGRKRFAKWLGNAIWHEEMEVKRHAIGFEDLEVYNNDVRYIADYLNGEDPREIPSNLWDSEFSEVMELGRHWHETLKGVEATGEFATKKVIYDFENGFTIVDVPAEDLETEGEYMGHCVGSYCDSVSQGIKAIYSLRDAKNRPHATIEVVNSQMRHGHESSIQQIKGKGNDIPAEKYRPMIKQWLKSTSFEYRENRDYINMLSEEEVMSMVTSGEASYRIINDIARTTRNPQILDFFVNAIADPNQETIKTMNNANRGSLMISLANSKNLSEAQVLRIVEIDLEIGVLVTNHSVETLFHATHPEFEETRPDGPVLSVAIWKNFREKLTQNVNENKLGYLSAIVKYSDNEPINKEIVNLLLDDEALDTLVRPKENDPYDTSLTAKGRTSDFYTDLLQNYLLYNKNPDRETLVRIYKFTRTLKGEILAGSHRMDTYIASSLSISPDVVEDMLSDKLDPPGLSTKKNLILNPSVEERHKYGLLTKMMDSDDAYAKQSGHPIVKQLGRLIWREKHFVDVDHFRSMPRIFSEKFLLWCLDAGVFDGVIQDSPGAAPPGHPARGEQYAETREQVKREILNLFREPTEEDFLDEQIRKHLRLCGNTTSAEAFYKNVEDEILCEEKGRSRQRGIYKFYCMLSYELTHDERHARGLDDILADLRAIPNVTIVTVVIRNQKTGEGRYIAGLSIKFIPSIPGEFNSPEDVKVRIIGDTRKLSNVKSIFKISAGLERIE